MMRPNARGPRAGITLTEILISILIMGVGMLSLATLFPLGLQRLREAARSSRSAHLIETAAQELASRDLLYKPSFAVNGYPYDPFTEDPYPKENPKDIFTGLDRLPANGSRYALAVDDGDPTTAPSKLAYGAGIPVCFDPLWWYQVNQASGGAVFPNLVAGSEYRFGSGIGLLRQDGGADPSAHGLQRITNFPFTYDPAPAFASPDDVVMQNDGIQPRDASGKPIVLNGPGLGSPVVPDLSTGVRLYDYAYTWIFTGRQTDVTNGTVFDGDIVIFHNRPFATEQVPATTASGKSGSVNRAAGETVVEAIWGYGVPSPALNPYSLNDRSVLLRWPVGQPDPDVRVGGWIADVTYERNSGIEFDRWYKDRSPKWTQNYPAQRCYWYRVAKKTDVTADHEMPTTYREMIVTVSSLLRARTPVTTGLAGPSAVQVNAALISPYVVNVVSKVFYTR